MVNDSEKYTSKDNSPEDNRPPGIDATLAIDGGEPVFPAGPPIWPAQNEATTLLLQQAARDGIWGKYHGPHWEKLRMILAQSHGVEHVHLCCSGTFAVELALRTLGVSAGDEVILSAYDFPGNFRAIEAIGARPVLVDINPQTWGIEPAHVPEALGPQTKAVIASHLHGGLIPMPELMQMARKYGFFVVEDACQSPLATIQGKPAGTWGDVGTLSFGGSKLLTAGRGGAILTSDPIFHQRAKVFCNRGNDAFPLSELQAALLYPQVKTLPQSNARRHQNVLHLRSSLGNTINWKTIESVSIDRHAEAWQPSYYKLPWLLPVEETPYTRAELITALLAEGVAVGEGFRGFFRRGKNRCRQVGNLSQSRLVAQHTMLLHHPILLENRDVIERLVVAIHKVDQGLRSKAKKYPSAAELTQPWEPPFGGGSAWMATELVPSDLAGVREEDSVWRDHPLVGRQSVAVASRRTADGEDNFDAGW